jgi:2-polyprenyl-3-methyl-5-hydroxy-6-metoxy-1,4-benzoquinol methylase
MKALDRILEEWRIAKALPYVQQGARVLDIGCGDGVLFERIGPALRKGVGIDPTLQHGIETDRWTLIRGRFPDDLRDAAPFDVITMLAVLEHVPLDEQACWVETCTRLLTPGGRVVITVPSPIVDPILALLKRVRLIDGMSLEQHYGFHPRGVPALFDAGQLELVKAARFQLGCNNLFVFRKAAG